MNIGKNNQDKKKIIILLKIGAYDIFYQMDYLIRDL